MDIIEIHDDYVGLTGLPLELLKRAQDPAAVRLLIKLLAVLLQGATLDLKLDLLLLCELVDNFACL
jgi:hypothetical protein